MGKSKKKSAAAPASAPAPAAVPVMEAALAARLAALGQSHIGAAWAPDGEHTAEKAAFAEQLEQLLAAHEQAVARAVVARVAHQRIHGRHHPSIQRRSH